MSMLFYNVGGQSPIFLEASYKSSLETFAVMITKIEI